jgi:single stranded DNA-binding protein
MGTVNKAILAGYVSGTPEFRHYKNGEVNVTFNLLTQTFKKTADGGWNVEKEYHRISAWKTEIKQIEKLVIHNNFLFITGTLRTIVYKDKEDGKDRYITQIIAHDIMYIGKYKQEKEEYE